MKKIISLTFVCLSLTFSSFAQSGTAGDLTWKITGDTLTISGYGTMPDYDRENKAPWSEYSEVITEVIINRNVTSIGSRAFYYCTGLTSVTLPKSVIRIGEYAFAHCSGLTSIKIPKSVTTIERFAFSGCTGFTSIKIPNRVTGIGDGAFSSCYGVTSIIIPNSVENIGLFAFSYCKSLTIITVGKGNVNYSSKDGFLYNKDRTRLLACSGGKTGAITIPDHVGNIGDGAFSGCGSLTSIIISKDVISIGHSAFASCVGLTSIIIPNSATSIEASAFFNCTSLTSITIPNSVTSIENWVFSHCPNLVNITVEKDNANYSSEDGILYNKDKTSLLLCPVGRSGAIIIPNHVTSIGYAAFYNCANLTSITIPHSVVSIRDWAFYCHNLTSIIIPNSVISIGVGAFSNCIGLTSVKIPDSVTSIDVAAFSGCTALTDIYSHRIYPLELGLHAFDRVNKSACILHVPVGSKQHYEEADGWREFVNIQEDDF